MTSIISRATRQSVWRQISGAKFAPSIALRSSLNLSNSQPQLISKPNLATFYRFNSSQSKDKASTLTEDVREKLGQDTPAKIYTYQDIKNLITNPDPTKILVDVREPHEFQQYAIPTSINIPYKSSPGALDLSPEEFEDVFKFEKPDKEKELIFYCLAGVRSSAATELAQIFGYDKLGNYVGSIEDWVKHEGIDINNPDQIKK
ncbi:hypothetical protein BN7_219 [Wickerhamomyces ciferrii]|uniref:Rhodanese domain-containing protein n=1 Tax=Wickerhamomyces ciferrii (strain ATCC 14091 / BCRC 22168 / CBS 111 / JCM 3599 / NBRC 0793 / NRRL Y-1031 F-60-10) TaxID=1206466 RepID=K0K745_WICCF|nr:uncharacterized protein BN7_219 [Wickerhamomyces ciferrii]CCH40685.1 hypothetical protein BN7_219 [Wickerhamomyces ciferrii]